MTRASQKSQGRHESVQGVSGRRCKCTNLSGRSLDAEQIEERQHEVVQGGEQRRGLAAGHLTGLFVERDIPAPVGAVFDAPW